MTNKHNFLKRKTENTADEEKKTTKQGEEDVIVDIKQSIPIITNINYADAVLSSQPNEYICKYNHKCACGKTYKYKQGLSVHKKKCIKIKEEKNDDIVKDEAFLENVSYYTNDTDKDNYLLNTIKELVSQNIEFNTLLLNENKEFNTMVLNENKEFNTMVLNENNELKNIIMEQTNKIFEKNKTSQNITNNIQNNKFNLNIFLNEECKDAINITDYVDLMELKLKDLEETARLGYTDGISKIINDRMRETSITKRPFHCTDGKREIVYVKDNNVWEKEQTDKPKMKKMITNVIHKNLQQLIKWHEKYPECADYLNNKSTEYLNIMIEANGGQEREKKEDQILKNILKEALLK